MNRNWKLFLMLAGVTAAVAANYDYKIDKKLLAALADDSDATAPFMIVFGERANLNAAYSIRNRVARGQWVGRTLKATADRSQAGVRGYLSGKKVAFESYYSENQIYVKQGTLELARDLAQRPEVAAIIPEEHYPVPVPQSGVGTIQAIEWGVAKIRADQVWPTTKGAGLVVANIDTGVQYNHP
ncbi:MAG: peptidase S8, partial [Gammaproteobacteria bacterium]